MCRCRSSVFLVRAVTIILAGRNCDALGPKRARGRGVVKEGIGVWTFMTLQ